MKGDRPLTGRVLCLFFIGHQYPTLFVGSARGSLIRVFTNRPVRFDIRLVRVAIWNLAMLPAIAHLLVVKDTMGFLTSTNKCWQTGLPINVHLKDSTHIDESPYL